VLVADVPLSTAHTVATTVGEWPEWILVVTALGAIIGAVVVSLRRPADDEPAVAPPATVEAR
jgi:apolipoprotein N-acyltransferase